MGDSVLTGLLRRIPTEEGWREKLGLELGTDVQPADPLLTAIAALSMVADRYIYGTGADTVALGTITSFIRGLLDDADAATARATLGLEYGTWTPTVTPGSGSFTTLGTRTGVYIKFGRLVWIQADVTITTNGTAASFIRLASPPVDCDTIAVFAGKEIAAVGTMLSGLMGGGGNIDIVTYNNGYPGGSGYRLILSGVYRVAS